MSLKTKLEDKYLYYRLKFKNWPWIKHLDYDRAEIRLTINGTPDAKTRIHSCAKEPETIEWIEKNVRPGVVFYDIGANVGAYSLVAAKYSDNRAQIFSFEPAFVTYPCLCQNVILNQCEQSISPFQICFAEKTGVTSIFLRNLKPGGSCHQVEESASDAFQGSSSYRQPILSFSLDDFIETYQAPCPELLKIDVDGNELGILKGASNTLRSSKLKSILVEIDETESIENRETIFKRLDEAGFAESTTHQCQTNQIFNHIFYRKPS